MKILAFSDTHASKDSAIATPSDSGYTAYQDVLLESFNFVKGVAEAVKPDIIAFLGDCFHSAGYVDTRSINIIGRGFSMLSGTPGTAIAIVGNHDLYSLASGIHSLEFLRSAGWRVVDEPTVFSICGYQVSCLPFGDTGDVLEVPPGHVTLSHIDIVGSVRRAMKSPNDIKALSDSGIPPNCFRGSRVVLNGHYHNPSFIKPNIHNIGSLLCRDFSDKESPPRGVTIFDTDTGVSMIENPHTPYFKEFFLREPGDEGAVLDCDTERTHGKIFYREGLQEQAEVAAEVLAGSWLYPVLTETEAEETEPLSTQFSLEANLRSYIKNNYNDEALETLAVEILSLVEQDSAKISARAPTELGQLEVRNFQSIGYASVNLRNQGLVLVVGDNRDKSDPSQSDNGSGKTTLIDSIRWCLTGKSPRGLKADEVIKWGEDSCSVALEIHVGDKLYTQVRSRNDPVHHTGSKLFVGGLSSIEDDSDISSRLMRAATDQVLDLIGRDEKSLNQIAFMTADDAGRFSKLGYDKRTRILEDILGAYPYKLAQVEAKSRCSSIEVNIAANGGECNSLIRTRDALSSEIFELNAELTAFDCVTGESDDSSKTRLMEFSDEQIRLQWTIKNRETSIDDIDLVVAKLQKKVVDYQNLVNEFTIRRSLN